MPSIIAPSTLSVARSPIFVTVAGAVNEIQSIVDCTIKVFIWSGSYSSRPTNPDYTLFRDKFVSNAEEVGFDIAPLVREELGGVFDTNITRNSPTSEQNNNVVWVDVDYIINYYSVSAPTVITNATGSSSTFPVSEGYYGYEQDLDSAVIIAGFLNNATTIHTKTSGNEMVSLWLGSYGAETIDSVRYKVGGVTKHTFDITSYQANVQPENQITRIPIGDTGLNNWLTSDGYTGASSDRPINQDTYQIVLVDDGSNEVATLNVVKECEPKYTIQTIRFLNKYGTWEFLNFFKRSDDDFEVQHEQYRKGNLTISRSGVSHDTDLEQYKRINTNGKLKITLNTGWVDESNSDTIKDLMMSERVMLDTSPVNVISGSMRLQKSINDKMINYTIEVEQAFDTRYV
jgi:hypothetical protein